MAGLSRLSSDDAPVVGDAPVVVAALEPMLELIVVLAEPVGIGVLLLVPLGAEVPVAETLPLPVEVPEGWPIVAPWPVAGIWFCVCVGAELVCAQTNDVLINKSAALALAILIALMKWSSLMQVLNAGASEALRELRRVRFGPRAHLAAHRTSCIRCASASPMFFR